MSFQRLVAPTMLAGIELIIYVYSQSETKRDRESGSGREMGINDATLLRLNANWFCQVL